MKKESFNLSFLQSPHPRSGQSLVEVVIGLAIGAILMGTAAFAVTTMLRTNLTSERSQFASHFAQALSDNVRAFAAGSWDGVYRLTKATSTHYFLNASGTTFFVVEGEEGVFDGEVPDGLTGRWGFDEVETSTSTTAYDATGNGRHATLNGPSRATSTCMIGNCLNFDGVNDVMTISNGSSEVVPAGNAAFSLSLWFNADAVGTSTLRSLASNETYAASGFRFGIGESDPQKLKFWSTESGGTISLTSTSTIAAGTRYHAVVVYTGSSATLYVDGAEEHTDSSGIVVSNTNDIKIAGAIGGKEYFDGTLDDVRFYNRALSSEEVRQLSHSGAYERFFTVENACRTNDASSTIASTAPCGGTLEDGSTQWATAYVRWVAGAGTGEITLPVILTRSRNAVFRQTDWSGGAASEGAVAEPTSKFASSTNASTTGGTIQIQNLSQQ
ncbi:MAG: prepilin-type N-terminal cleavage/methylation domain-containing protein [Candidatus Brennerbacteria bacterium]|nr:prepilin-type N-terminal cleavage/methylation domain-containing protein [Candidatus Brennerbacteria bacterium]